MQLFYEKTVTVCIGVNTIIDNNVLINPIFSFLYFLFVKLFEIGDEKYIAYTINNITLYISVSHRHCSYY